MTINQKLIYFGGILIIYSLYLAVRAKRKRPRIKAADVVYQEWFATGHSAKNFCMMLGDCKSCVRLIVTREYLIVTSWFPFILFSAFLDMEHVIPLDGLEPIRTTKGFFRGDYLRLNYRDIDGEKGEIELMPQDRRRFIGSLANRVLDPI